MIDSYQLLTSALVATAIYLLLIGTFNDLKKQHTHGEYSPFSRRQYKVGGILLLVTVLLITFAKC
jgi:hypothetical protein